MSNRGYPSLSLIEFGLKGNDKSKSFPKMVAQVVFCQLFQKKVIKSKNIVKYYETTNQKKIWNHKICTKKMWNPRNFHEKNFEPKKYTREKIWTHDIPTSNNLGPTKYSQEKICDRPNTHEKIFSIYDFGPTKYPW